MIETNSKRESGKSVLSAWHDNDDDDDILLFHMERSILKNSIIMISFSYLVSFFIIHGLFYAKATLEKNSSRTI